MEGAAAVHLASRANGQTAGGRFSELLCFMVLSVCLRHVHVLGRVSSMFFVRAHEHGVSTRCAGATPERGPTPAEVHDRSATAQRRASQLPPVPTLRNPVRRPAPSGHGGVNAIGEAIPPDPPPPTRLSRTRPSTAKRRRLRRDPCRHHARCLAAVTVAATAGSRPPPMGLSCVCTTAATTLAPSLGAPQLRCVLPDKRVAASAAVLDARRGRTRAEGRAIQRAAPAPGATASAAVAGAARRAAGSERGRGGAVRGGGGVGRCALSQLLLSSRQAVVVAAVAAMPAGAGGEG